MEKLYDNIENYLRGKLPQKEQDAFTDRLKQDQHLKEEVKAFRIARDVIENNIADELRADFATWDKESSKATQHEAKVVQMRPSRWKKIALAASIVLLAYTFISWYNTNTDFNSQTLAMSTFESTEIEHSMRSTLTDENELSYGQAAMEAGDYEEAIQQFEAIEVASDYYMDAQLKLAGAYFAADQLGPSETTLKPLLLSSNTIVKEKAEWLYVLTRLKQGEKSSPEFKDLLKNIAENDEHYYAQEAKSLMNTLDGFWVRLVK